MDLGMFFIMQSSLGWLKLHLLTDHRATAKLDKGITLHTSIERLDLVNKCPLWSGKSAPYS